MSVQAVPLGDALQRAVAQIYSDTNLLLLDLKRQDPELRTTELRSFLANSKAKLLQLLSIVRWLGKPHIMQLFHSITQYNMDMATIDGVMARNLDEMFFIHGSVFPLRSSKHECVVARQVMTNGVYCSLPMATNSAGRKPLPADTPAPILQGKLDLFIRCKLARLDPLPKDSRYVVAIRSGVLHVSCRNVFRLQLTLQALASDASWMLVHFACPRMFENHSSSDYSDMDLLTKHLQQLDQVKLSSICELCEHVSNRLQMRGLHDALRAKKNSPFCNCSDVRLVEDKEMHCLWVYFWKSEFSGQHQFAIKIFSPSPSPLGGDGIGLLRSRVSIVRAATDIALPHIQHILPQLDDLLATDGGAQAICDKVITALAEVKLLMLHNRLSNQLSSVSPQVSVPSNLRMNCFERLLQAFFSSRQVGRVVLNLARCDVHVCFTVDQRSGKYLIDCRAALPLMTMHGNDLQRLLAEINNVEVETHFFSSMCDQGVLQFLKHNEIAETSRIAPQSAIINLDMFCSLLELQPYFSALLCTLYPVSAEEHAGLYAPFRSSNSAMCAFRLSVVEEHDVRNKLAQTLRKSMESAADVAPPTQKSATDKRVDALPASKKARTTAPEKMHRPLRLIFVALALCDGELQGWTIHAKAEVVHDKLVGIVIAKQESVFTLNKASTAPATVVEMISMACCKMADGVSPELQAAPVIANGSRIDMRSDSDRFLAFPVGDLLHVAFLQSQMNPGIRFPLDDVLNHLLMDVQADPDEVAACLTIRHYVRELGGAVLHSWALESMKFRQLSLDRISDKDWLQSQSHVMLAVHSMCAAFCCSLENEYKTGATSAMVLVRAVLAIATGGLYKSLVLEDGSEVNVRCIGHTDNTIRSQKFAAAPASTCPFDLMLAIEKEATASKELIGYARLSVLSSCFCSSHNSGDVVAISDLSRRSIASFTPQDICVKRVIEACCQHLTAGSSAAL